MFPEQFIISESAVDIVAAKIPAIITPTINGLNNSRAIKGKASSGSKPTSMSRKAKLSAIFQPITLKNI